MKKLLLALCMITCLFGLTACGSEKEAVTYDEETLKAVADYMITTFTQIPEETLREVLDYDEEELNAIVNQIGLPMENPKVFSESINAFLSSQKELGAYKSTDNYSFEVSGDRIVLTVTTTFEKRVMHMSVNFNAKSKMTSVTIDPVYSMAEILEKAALNTVLGMGTVFLVLIFISLLISCFSIIPKLEAKFKKQPEAVAEKGIEQPVFEALEPEEELAEDEELVAVIAAAIAAYEGTSADGFVVRSIKKSNAGKWKRA